MKSLYDKRFEFDSCGIGFVANIKGNKNNNTVTDALTVLENMKHRGACGCEENSGDGAGIMTQIPHEFLYEECEKLGFTLPVAGKYAVGMLFLPKASQSKQECFDIINRCSRKLNLEVLGYRQVPTNSSQVGITALKHEPDIYQVFLTNYTHNYTEIEFERKLFVLRKHITHVAMTTIAVNNNDFYIASLSVQKLIYKGQLTSDQLRTYYPDLSDSRFISAFGLVHSRFSTNTQPEWRLAQPFRFLAHNGEINTLSGNLNWLTSREKSFISKCFSQEELDMLIPLISRDQSDSACLDNMVELLTLSGRDLAHVMMMLIPEAWENNELLDPEVRAFYEFHSYLVEPWDGPAALAFSDGKSIGATLDRNGLRPARYWVTRDGRVILASESGVLEIANENVLSKGMLQPGEMILVDFMAGKVNLNRKIKKTIATNEPYIAWLKDHKIRLENLPAPLKIFAELTVDQIFKYQKAFGYSEEDLEHILLPMAVDAKEPVGSMGSDIPLAILSNKPQHLSSYFKQLFAQVTNPPIDSIRERGVMSLTALVGSVGNLLIAKPEDCHVLQLEQPILNEYQLSMIRSIDSKSFQAKTLYTYFNADGAPGSLKKGLDRVCRYVEDAIHDGFKMIILSDRSTDSKHAAIPSLLVIATVHQYLNERGLRGNAGLVLETGDAFEVHHFACLIGFGANAICPYLAFASIHSMQKKSLIDKNITANQLNNNYIKAINDGLLKIFAKMGISTLHSYLGAQVFEALGLNDDVIANSFAGVISRLGGMGLDEIAEETLLKHKEAYNENYSNYLPGGGVYKWRVDGESHMFNPQTIHLLQNAVRKNDYNIYKKYARLIDEQDGNFLTLRGLFEFKRHKEHVPLDEVEPIENILKRFATGAMSFGSISWEAHTTLAIAMNRIGAKSNTGEGGEDEIRYDLLENGDSMRSSIKQIASGRFGVTSRYLVEADELQIKLAQGAKPGEGGQLPGHKVDDWIGKTRYSTPGVSLISPPPHHDIYSIEDLAQTIFDLKNSNTKARISVKLVAKAGVGTIANGVVKAKADVVLIAGHDGGTGASPVSSIRHAGLPWEMGLAETHQTLVKSNLRDRVVVQADGQMKTAKDIAIATLLGAEEWGIATAALVAEGCILMRKCHLNTCPVGIATQDPELRKLFNGKPEHVVNYFYFLAQELRDIMSFLGFRTINEMVGQSNCLKVKSNITHWKAKHLDLSGVLYYDPLATNLYKSKPQDNGLDNILDLQLLEVSKPALERRESVTASFIIQNVNRSVGTMLGSQITRQFKAETLADNTINFKFTGTAGQSFAAFTPKGITFELEGDANDYVGKGLSGANIIVYPSRASLFTAADNIIIGNVAFYGATSGNAYINGVAGERFAVRNSGANLVVEGAGDHCCEYMTGGRVIVLGTVGKNFAAGMSGGIAYVYDKNSKLSSLTNLETVELDPINSEDETYLTAQLNAHIKHTRSEAATDILKNLQDNLRYFTKVFPREYKKIMQGQKNG